MEVVSWKPRVFMFHDFLSDDEAQHLIRLAEPDMQRSTVADDVTGELVEDPYRTSSSLWLNRSQDAVVTAIERRVELASRLPLEHQEPFEVLRYAKGEKNLDHFDFFKDDSNTKNGGQRGATVLLYLSDVEEGGETVFYTGNQTADEASCVCNADVVVRPVKNSALLFFNLKPGGENDPQSRHSGCPVVKGVKWSATKWIRTGPHIPEELLADAGDTAEAEQKVVEVIKYVYVPVPADAGAGAGAGAGAAAAAAAAAAAGGDAAAGAGGATAAAAAAAAAARGQQAARGGAEEVALQPGDLPLAARVHAPGSGAAEAALLGAAAAAGAAAPGAGGRGAEAAPGRALPARAAGAGREGRPPLPEPEHRAQQQQQQEEEEEEEEVVVQGEQEDEQQEEQEGEQEEEEQRQRPEGSHHSRPHQRDPGTQHQQHTQDQQQQQQQRRRHHHHRRRRRRHHHGHVQGAGS